MKTNGFATYSFMGKKTFRSPARITPSQVNVNGKKWTKSGKELGMTIWVRAYSILLSYELDGVITVIKK